MLPKLTLKETGWRKTLAVYRIMHTSLRDLGMPRKDALAKLGVKDLASANKTSKSAEDLVGRFAFLEDVYHQFEMIEPFCSVDRELRNMVSTLAKYSITDISKWSGEFATLRGIGPKYAEVLFKAREAAANRKPLVDMHIRVDPELRDKYKELAKEKNKAISELVSDILQEHIKKVG